MCLFPPHHLFLQPSNIKAYLHLCALFSIQLPIFSKATPPNISEFHPLGSFFSSVENHVQSLLNWIILNMFRSLSHTHPHTPSIPVLPPSSLKALSRVVKCSTLYPLSYHSFLNPLFSGFPPSLCKNKSSRQFQSLSYLPLQRTAVLFFSPSLTVLTLLVWFDS